MAKSGIGFNKKIIIIFRNFFTCFFRYLRAIKLGITRGIFNICPHEDSIIMVTARGLFRIIRPINSVMVGLAVLVGVAFGGRSLFTISII